jgi:hypothetical protein
MNINDKIISIIISENKLNEEKTKENSDKSFELSNNNNFNNNNNNFIKNNHLLGNDFYSPLRPCNKLNCQNTRITNTYPIKNDNNIYQIKKDGDLDIEIDKDKHKEKFIQKEIKINFFNEIKNSNQNNFKVPFCNNININKNAKQNTSILIKSNGNNNNININNDNNKNKITNFVSNFSTSNEKPNSKKNNNNYIDSEINNNFTETEKEKEEEKKKFSNSELNSNFNINTFTYNILQKNKNYNFNSPPNNNERYTIKSKANSNSNAKSNTNTNPNTNINLNKSYFNIDSNIDSQSQSCSQNSESKNHKRKNSEDFIPDRFLPHHIKNVFIDDKFDIMQNHPKRENYKISKNLNLPFTIKREKFHANNEPELDIRVNKNTIIERTKSHSAYLKILKASLVDEKFVDFKKIKEEINDDSYSSQEKNNNDVDIKKKRSREIRRNLSLENSYSYSYQNKNKNKSNSNSTSKFNKSYGSNSNNKELKIEDFANKRKISFTPSKEKKNYKFKSILKFDEIGMGIDLGLGVNNNLNLNNSKGICNNNINNKINNDLSNLNNFNLINKSQKALFNFGISYIEDNFYLNNLDIYEYNSIAIGSEQYLNFIKIGDEDNFDFLKSFKESEILNNIPSYEENLIKKGILCRYRAKNITAVKYLKSNRVLINERSEGIKIFDKENLRFLWQANMKEFSQNNPINTIDNNGNYLFFGGERSGVSFVDIRDNNTPKLLYHHTEKSEICSVRYSPENNFVISGGNDNRIFIFDLRNFKLINNINSNLNPNIIYSSQDQNKNFYHQAAIKGLDFNHSESILVSGGGTKDKKIKIWDLKKLTFLHEIQTESQISNIKFIDNKNFLVSFGQIYNNSMNYRLNFKYNLNLINSSSIISKDYLIPSFSSFNNDNNNNEFLLKENLFESHRKRILYMSKSSKGKYFSTCSSDGIVKLFNYSKYVENTIEAFNLNYEIR